MVRNVVTEWQYYSLALLENWELKLVISFCASFVVDVTGISYVLAQIFLASMLIDFLLGLYVAIKFNHFRFYKIRKGVSKIALWVFYVILVSWGDFVFWEVFNIDGEKHYLATWLTASIIFTEFSSIIKHCHRLQLPIPDALILINQGAKDMIKKKIQSFFSSGDDKKK